MFLNGPIHQGSFPEASKMKKTNTNQVSRAVDWSVWTIDSKRDGWMLFMRSATWAEIVIFFRTPTLITLVDIRKKNNANKESIGHETTLFLG